jgi:hypothetical protein
LLIGSKMSLLAQAICTRTVSIRLSLISRSSVAES